MELVSADSVVLCKLAKCFQSRVEIEGKCPFKHTVRFCSFKQARNTAGLNSTLFASPLLSPPLLSSLILSSLLPLPSLSPFYPLCLFSLSVSLYLSFSFFPSPSIFVSLPLIICIPKFFPELKVT